VATHLSSSRSSPSKSESSLPACEPFSICWSFSCTAYRALLVSLHEADLVSARRRFVRSGARSEPIGRYQSPGRGYPRGGPVDMHPVAAGALREKGAGRRGSLTATTVPPKPPSPQVGRLTGRQCWGRSGAGVSFKQIQSCGWDNYEVVHSGNGVRCRVAGSRFGWPRQERWRACRVLVWDTLKGTRQR